MGQGVNVPAGFGGLMRFNEEYHSKIQLKPAHVIVFVIMIIVFVLFLRVFFPIV